MDLNEWQTNHWYTLSKMICWNIWLEWFQTLKLVFQNSIQPLRHAGIFSYLNPISLKYFLAWYVSLGSFASFGTIPLRNLSNFENNVLLHPLSYFKLNSPTLTQNILWSVHPDHSGSFDSFNKLNNFLASSVHSSSCWYKL
jgi:hypothetical protein